MTSIYEKIFFLILSKHDLLILAKSLGVVTDTFRIFSVF